MRYSGEQWLFGLALQEQYGEHITTLLYNTATKGKPPTNEQLKYYIEYYTAQIAAILTKRIERDRWEHRSLPADLSRRIRVGRSRGQDSRS